MAPKKSGALTSTLTEATFSPQRTAPVGGMSAVARRPLWAEGCCCCERRGDVASLVFTRYSGARDMVGVDEVKA